MHRRKILAALAAVTLCVSAAALAQPPAPSAGPIVKAGTTQKISEHVYVIPDGSVGGVPNVGIIVGRTGTLIIDTGMGAPNGRTVLAEAQKVSGTNKLYLVTTHVHPEHDLGAHAFPASVTLIRSADQVREIGEEGMRTAEAFRGRSAVNAQLLEGAVFRPADQTFTGSRDLDLGGVTVRILAMGPNHTQGDTAVWVPGDAVLFSGDVAMRGMPAFASSKSSLAHWLTSLDRFEAMGPRIVVPSHGPNGDVAYVSNYRRYLTLIRDKSGEAKRSGRTADQAVESVTADLRAAGFDTARAAGAIRAAYAEAR